MTLNFALFNYFPFGGLQRDFLKTATECHKLGCDITVYTTQWTGLRPAEFNIHIIPVKGSSNHQRMNNFQAEVVRIKKASPDIPMIGFNKTDGLDVYFASDTCFKEKAHSERSCLYRLTSRYKVYKNLEQAVFRENADTLILTLTEQQQQDFQKHYRTQSNRFKLLPPGIKQNTFTANRPTIRHQYREAFKIKQSDTVLLLIGSNFGTKGLGRTLIALSSLPEKQRQQTTLLIVGGDKQERFIKKARQLKVNNRIIFAGSRNDVEKIMLCADLLIHPAYTESAGMVLVEAIAAGLPVLTTENCGYAFHVKAADAGVVIPMPFEQPQLNQALEKILESEPLGNWLSNAIKYAGETDLYSLHKRAAQIIFEQAKDIHA